MRTLDCLKWGDKNHATYALWCYRQATFYGPHDQTFYELFWVESGQGQYWINGNVEGLAEGDLVLVRPEDQHSFAAAKSGQFIEFVNVAFLPGLWENVAGRYFQGAGKYFSEKDYRRRRYRLSPAELLRIRDLASALRKGARDGLSVEAFLLGLLSLLEEKERSSDGSHMPGWLVLALEQIQIFPNFDGGPASFVRLAGRSPEHVARECRRHLDRAPNDIVNEARMEHAARELQDGEKKIVDIALECGIENLGHFYQLFRKRFGMPPAEYRRQMATTGKGRLNG